MIKIRESIVVEGKGDCANLSRVCDANFIITGGLHISQKTYGEIALAIEKSGIIIFTDPDSAGRSIRNKIVEHFKDKQDRIKHANISVKEAKKDGDVGVENAGKGTLLSALNTLRGKSSSRGDSYGQETNENRKIRGDEKKVYTMREMRDFGLAGSQDSAKKRETLCNKLRISYCNAKTLAKKLTYYGIEPDEILRKIN